MERKINIALAKNKLTSIIYSVENGTPVQLTRHGKPVAVLLSIDEYERLSQKREGFWETLIAFRKIIEKECVEISDSDFKTLRDTSTGREVSLNR